MKRDEAFDTIMKQCPKEVVKRNSMIIEDSKTRSEEVPTRRRNSIIGNLWKALSKVPSGNAPQPLKRETSSDKIVTGELHLKLVFTPPGSIFCTKNLILTIEKEKEGLLVVEVVEARNLLPREGNVPSDPYIKLQFGKKQVIISTFHMVHLYSMFIGSKMDL
jgi:hypothetical protein